MPDYGPAKLGPAGATVIGARSFLIAFNVYLNTGDVEIARKIAKAVRHSSGGLRYVKAAGFLVEGQAQVSMNLTNYRKTPVARVVETIRREAARYGCAITKSELVGLTPQEALIDAAQWYLQLDMFESHQILENKLREALSGQPKSIIPHAFLEATAAGSATPGGGAVAALAGALSAALAGMVARLSIGKKKYAAVEAQMKDIAARADGLRGKLTASIDEDSAAFEEVMNALKSAQRNARRNRGAQRADTNRHAARHDRAAAHGQTVPGGVGLDSLCGGQRQYQRHERCRLGGLHGPRRDRCRRDECAHQCRHTRRQESGATLRGRVEEYSGPGPAARRSGAGGSGKARDVGVSQCSKYNFKQGAICFRHWEEANYMDKTLAAFETTATVDERHQLRLDAALPIIGPMRVRVIVLYSLDEDIDETAWLYTAAHNPALASLHDASEDIYSLDDGRPLDAEA